MAEPKNADLKKKHRALKTAVDAVNAANHHPGPVDDAFMTLVEAVFTAVDELKKITEVYPDSVAVKVGSKKVYKKGEVHEYGTMSVTYDAFDGKPGKRQTFKIP